MHKLSVMVSTVAFGTLVASCGSTRTPLSPDVSSQRGMKLVFESVCMPSVLDGGDFGALADARLMTSMSPAFRGVEQAIHSYRLYMTGVTASTWKDGSCTVGIERGDSASLRAQALESLRARGLTMTQGITSAPAVNSGVADAYCTAEARPLILTVTTPMSDGHALIATLYRARDSGGGVCRVGEAP